MTTDELIAHFRTIAAAARALRIKGPSVAEWIAKGEIPIDRQCQIEVLTEGALRADRKLLGPPAPAAPTSSQEAAA